MAAAESTGRLVLVPNSLDLATEAVPLPDVLPMAVIQQAARLRHWVVETPKVARAFLGRVHAITPLAAPLQALDIQALPRAAKGGPTSAEAPGPGEWEALLAPALAGQDLGVLSDAGLPAVADPGAALVAAAHRKGVPVVVLAGGSSLALALAASGLNGQRFAFEGYLPQDPADRARRVQQLTTRSAQEGQTQVVIETPYRNNALLGALLQQLPPDTRLSVAWGLTCPGGGCRTLSVREWRATHGDVTAGALLPDRLPAVFLWLASPMAPAGAADGATRTRRPQGPEGRQPTPPAGARQARRR